MKFPALVQRRRLFLIALFVSGLLIIFQGVKLSGWRSEQIESYNQGLAAYAAGDLESAVALFDQSIAAYERELEKHGWFYRLVYGESSRELAALANFQKGKAYLRAQQVRPAIEAFMESLRLNPGNDYTFLGVATQDTQRMFDQALIVKYDLELLFRKYRSQSQQSQSQQSEPAEQGDQPVPGTGQDGQPGDGDGEGGGDDL